MEQHSIKIICFLFISVFTISTLTGCGRQSSISSGIPNETYEKLPFKTPADITNSELTKIDPTGTGTNTDTSINSQSANNPALSFLRDLNRFYSSIPRLSYGSDIENTLFDLEKRLVTIPEIIRLCGTQCSPAIIEVLKKMNATIWVYRYRSENDKNNIFTTSINSRGLANELGITDSLKFGGAAFRVFKTKRLALDESDTRTMHPDAVPLVQCQINEPKRVFFLTRDLTCGGRGKSTILGYMVSPNKSATANTPHSLFRLKNAKLGTHIATIDDEERKNLKKNGWVDNEKLGFLP